MFRGTAGLFSLPLPPGGCFVARQARQACFLDPLLPEGHFVARQAWVIGLELQNKRFHAQIGGIKDNDAREGFFLLP
jgi:hypothetical protein